MHNLESVFGAFIHSGSIKSFLCNVLAVMMLDIAGANIKVICFLYTQYRHLFWYYSLLFKN